MKKVVIDLSGNNQKTRQEAMKIACGTSGVSGVAIQENDKRKLEVKGEGVDAANLTLLLRKKLTRKCYFLGANNPVVVTLVSVGPVEQKKPPEEKPKEEPGYPAPMYIHELREPGCACSIM